MTRFWVVGVANGKSDKSDSKPLAKKTGFVRDMMCMMAAGLTDADLQRYADTAERAFLPTDAPDVALWDLIRIALLSDSTPHSAVEFARQAIPFALRPSFAELQAMMKQVGRDYAAQTEEPPEPLTARVAAWFAREDR